MSCGTTLLETSRRYLGLKRSSNPRDTAPPVIRALPGARVGERGRLLVLEPADCDEAALGDRILRGRYGKPFILDDGRTRRLYFDLRFVQSAMRLDDPFALDFAYTRKMMAFLLFAPNPERLLMVGLGGGSLAKFCHHYLPSAHVTVVEIDPHVIALRTEFGIQEDERLKIIQGDAADYLPMATQDTDVLLLDGFNADGVAPSFLSPTFYQAAHARLRSGGVLVANFCGLVEHWYPHFLLLNEAFEGRVYLSSVKGGGNYIAFAFTEDVFPLEWSLMTDRAQRLAALVPLDFAALLERLRHGAKAPPTAKLHDV